MKEVKVKTRSHGNVTVLQCWVGNESRVSKILAMASATEPCLQHSENV